MIQGTGKARSRFMCSMLALALWIVAHAGSTLAHADTTRTLRVCADSDNLPFSNRNEEGFENRIVALIAQDLNATVSYTWWVEGSGFLPSSLKAGACDIVMGLPRGMGVVPLTRPYYRSSYVLVYLNGKFPGLRSLDDPRLRQLKIGVASVGEDSNAPALHALARRQLTQNVVTSPVPGADAGHSQTASIVEAVVSGRADVALVWGPAAGHLAARQRVPLSVVPVSPTVDPSGLPLHFDIAVGVKPGDSALRQEIDAVLERRRDEIHNILRSYSVPLVSATALSV